MSTARGRFTQSAPFASLLAQYTVETQDGTLGPTGMTETVLIHEGCAETVVALTDGDTMTQIMDAILDHDCEC